MTTIYNYVYPGSMDIALSGPWLYHYEYVTQSAGCKSGGMMILSCKPHRLLASKLRPHASVTDGLHVASREPTTKDLTLEIG